MIQRTWLQCTRAVDADKIVVATDDSRIKDHCESFGARAIITAKQCPTGTDRIASLLEDFDEDYFINVQGDEPIMNPEDLNYAIEVTKTGEHDVINGYAPIEDENSFFSSAVPKVVFSDNGNLLYMSRAPIPGSKQGKFQSAWRQICIYGFSRKALKSYRQYGGKAKLESIEDVEILRFLEIGIPVKMIPMSTKSIPVDYPEDIVKVEEVIYNS